MCILPNFQESDLATFKQKRKEENKEAKTGEMTVPESLVLENLVQ